MARRSSNKAVRISVFKEPESGTKKVSHDYVHYTVPITSSDKFSLNSSTITTEGSLPQPEKTRLAPVLSLGPPTEGSNGDDNNLNSEEAQKTNKGKGVHQSFFLARNTETDDQ